MQIDTDEIDYLLGAIGNFFATNPKREDVVWNYSGVRSLFDDDSSASASKVTRDYHLDLASETGQPPLLSVFGGKITTYRCLAEEALAKLSTVFPSMGRPWTAEQPLPGGDMPNGGFASLFDDLKRQYPALDPVLVAHMARRHGSLIRDVLGDANRPEDLGVRMADGLFEREVLYMKNNEWARTAEDILWRRTKAGVGLSPEQRDAATEAIGKLL